MSRPNHKLMTKVILSNDKQKLAQQNKKTSAVGFQTRDKGIPVWPTQSNPQHIQAGTVRQESWKQQCCLVTWLRDQANTSSRVKWQKSSSPRNARLEQSNCEPVWPNPSASGTNRHNQFLQANWGLSSQIHMQMDPYRKSSLSHLHLMSYSLPQQIWWDRESLGPGLPVFDLFQFAVLPFPLRYPRLSHDEQHRGKHPPNRYETVV